MRQLKSLVFSANFFRKTFITMYHKRSKPFPSNQSNWNSASISRHSDVPLGSENRVRLLAVVRQKPLVSHLRRPLAFLNFSLHSERFPHLGCFFSASISSV